MITKWTEHLADAEEKKLFEAKINSAKPVLDRLIAILKQQEDGLDRYDRSVDSYEDPNWAYKQAFRNGQRNVNNAVKTLIDLDQHKGIYIDQR